MVLIDLLVFALYRFLALPFVLVLLQVFKNLLPGKVQEMIADRSNLNLQALPARPIWIHASSGEVEYAKSVIRALKEEFPQVPVLVTYFSPSAKKLIQKFPGIDLSMALPWDRKQDLEKFLNFYNPRACLIARTDVWPQMARMLRARKIPSVLFAATFATESSRRGILSGALTRVALNSLSRIDCVSREDQENLLALGVRVPVEIAGDTRFDQVLHRLAHPNPVHLPFKPRTGEKIFVCGSTWPADEDVLLASFEFWLSQGGRIILAPHEVAPTRISILQGLLEKRGWSVQRYSSSAASELPLAGGSWNTQILLVDQVGCLQELYTWGSFAFVGGSFKDKVHSVMEPLCVGLPVAVGPYHRNNREALSFQHVILGPGFFAVNVVQNARDLQDLMARVLVAPTPHPVILQRVRESSGATERLMDWMHEVIQGA